MPKNQWFVDETYLNVAGKADELVYFLPGCSVSMARSSTSCHRQGVTWRPSQGQVAEAFGVDPATIWRWDQAMACGGVAGLVPVRRGPNGASKLTPRWRRGSPGWTPPGRRCGRSPRRPGLDVHQTAARAPVRQPPLDRPGRHPCIWNPVTSSTRRRRPRPRRTTAGAPIWPSSTHGAATPGRPASLRPSPPRRTGWSGSERSP